METLEKDIFSFNETEHIYLLNGKPLTGVTTILGVLNKPLTWWAAGKALEALGWTNPKFVKKEEGIKIAAKARKNFFINNEEYYKWLQECYRAHDNVKKEAGAAGTDVHSLVERFVQRCIDEMVGDPHHNIVYETDIIYPFVKWARENNIRFLMSEKQVYSKEYWYAGTLDLLMEKDGKILIGDVKTSKDIYPSYFYQMAGYRICLEEMGEKVDGSVVIRLKDGKLEDQYRYDFATDRAAFMGALAIYRANGTYIK